MQSRTFVIASVNCVGSTTGNTYLYNSTFINSSGNAGYVMEAPGLSLTMRNCVPFGNRNQVVSGGGFNTLDEYYNLYFSN